MRSILRRRNSFTPQQKLMAQAPVRGMGVPPSPKARLGSMSIVRRISVAAVAIPKHLHWQRLLRMSTLLSSSNSVQGISRLERWPVFQGHQSSRFAMFLLVNQRRQRSG